jgi:hypothetical protein
MSQAHDLAVVDNCAAVLRAPLPKRGPHSRNVNIGTKQGLDAMGSFWGRRNIWHGHGHRGHLGHGEGTEAPRAPRATGAPGTA